MGKVCTTDAFYRETKDKVKRRKERIQFFYAADNLDSEEWDVRSLSNYDKLEEKDRIAVIALELALKISNCKAEKTDDNDMS